jgi:hypothetical protein
MGHESVRGQANWLLIFAIVIAKTHGAFSPAYKPRMGMPRSTMRCQELRTFLS